MLDNDISGHSDLLAGTLNSTGGAEYDLVKFISLTDGGLARNAIDREIWHHCQRNSLILLTANRNQDDPDSLEQTLRELNTEYSLPVITVSDSQRLIEPTYREQCIHSLIGIILDLINYLGTARIYIP